MEKVKKKLAILADAAKYDASCASSGSTRERRDQGLRRGLGNTEGMGICHSYTPDGRCVSLLKILLTNYCIYDCHFCINRVSSDTPRARFTPEEVAWLTVEFYKRNYIEGLFLSSGIIQSPDYTMEQLVRAAKLLREDHLFNGYIHLKAIPGASPELLAEAGRHADRLSANIELAREKDLVELAPAKSHSIIERSMTEIRDKIVSEERPDSRRSFAPAGQTTQMIVGASDATDAEILSKAASLYKTQRLRRVYYSAFSPIPHADPLLPLIKIPLIREHRLYQADWLFRFYGFSLEELTGTQNQNLSLELDPKTVWALDHREVFPVDVNTAPRELLLRVPGFGVRTVNRILTSRRHGALRYHDLVTLRIPMNRAKHFVITADTLPRTLDTAALTELLRPPPQQLSLFSSPQASSESGVSALTGEV